MAVQFKWVDFYEEFASKLRSVYKELHADRETGC